MVAIKSGSPNHVNFFFKLFAQLQPLTEKTLNYGRSLEERPGSKPVKLSSTGVQISTFRRGEVELELVHVTVTGLGRLSPSVAEVGINSFISCGLFCPYKLAEFICQ